MREIDEAIDVILRVAHYAAGLAVLASIAVFFYGDYSKQPSMMHTAAKWGLYSAVITAVLVLVRRRKVTTASLQGQTGERH